MYILVFSKIIHEDIDSSYIYIKETLEAPQAAENLIKELIEKLSYIKETPYTRPLVQDKYLASYLASLGVRSIKIKNYVLYYNVEEKIKVLMLSDFFIMNLPAAERRGIFVSIAIIYEVRSVRKFIVWGFTTIFL